MKTYLAILAVLFVSVGLAFKAGARSQKHKNFEAERYSAEWGCLAGAMHACPKLPNEKALYGCLDEMYEKYCPNAAKSFEKFMSQSY